MKNILINYKKDFMNELYNQKYIFFKLIKINIQNNKIKEFFFVVFFLNIKKIKYLFI